MALLRLSNIANYLTFERNLDNAIQFVGMNACSSGRVARIYLARLHSDSSLTHISSFGFSEAFIAEHQKFKMAELTDLMKSVHSKEVIIKSDNSKVRVLESDSKQHERKVVWRSSVYIPLLPNFAASLATQIHISNNEENRVYFGALRSVLNLYLQNWDALENSNSPRTQKVKTASVGQKLTERQEIILLMIKEGLTNISIAERMGYSESLIRQETIIIYQKLGIDGRREIKGISQ